MSDQEYVRSRWGNDLPKCMVYERFDIVDPEGDVDYAAAAKFTRQRDKEIRLVREEIEKLKHLMESAPDAVLHRILARLNAELALLTAGMQQIEEVR